MNMEAIITVCFSDPGRKTHSSGFQPFLRPCETMAEPATYGKIGHGGQDGGENLLDTGFDSDVCIPTYKTIPLVCNFAQKKLLPGRFVRSLEPWRIYLTNEPLAQIKHWFYELSALSIHAFIFLRSSFFIE